MTTRIPFSAGGLDGEFTGLVGMVIGTDQRSDSYTYGGGSTTSVGSQVVGNTTVRTDVVVSRDIWLRDAEGREHHKRLTMDLPVRVGQRFCFIDYSGLIQGTRTPLACPMRVVNLSTDRAYLVNEPNIIAQTLFRSAHEDFTFPVIIGWAVSTFLCLFLGLGLLGIAALTARHMKVRGVRLAGNQAIQAIVEAKFRDMLALVDAEGARLVASSEVPTAPHLQSGTA